MGAQNFNFASKFPQNWVFSPKLCILDENFPTKEKFPTIFIRPKIWRGAAYAPPPRGQCLLDLSLCSEVLRREVCTCLLVAAKSRLLLRVRRQ